MRMAKRLARDCGATVELVEGKHKHPRLLVTYGSLSRTVVFASSPKTGTDTVLFDVRRQLQDAILSMRGL